ncbi:Molybdenum ABC transporter substrate-binding protein [Bordetella sputigena]|uniref:substrate-binding domain-containing protein n=1 Tax=Bordetella sputigena TaxID=1416810 RepID=UPI0039EF30F3
MATLNCISSMATKRLLEEAAADFRAQTGISVALESVGGVVAAKRVSDGEPFDVVILAQDALDALAAAGKIEPSTMTAIALSQVAVAVADAAPAHALDRADDLRALMSSAPRIGYSTGPSGVALISLIREWGMYDALQPKLVQAPSGVPVARLIADGTVQLGLQQRSELLGMPGIRILGDMPPGAEINTVFSGAVRMGAAAPNEAAGFLAYLASDRTTALKTKIGMTPLQPR